LLTTTDETELQETPGIKYRRYVLNQKKVVLLRLFLTLQVLSSNSIPYSDIANLARKQLFVLCGKQQLQLI